MQFYADLCKISAKTLIFIETMQINLHISKFFCTFAHQMRAADKQANRKIMADIEKLHHSQDLARVRTEIEMDPFP